MALFNFAVRYVADHPELEPGFRVSRADVAEFRRSMASEEREVSAEDFAAADRFVRYHLEREIALQAWGESGRFFQLREYDTQLRRAIEVLSGVNSLDELLRFGTEQDRAAAGG